MKKLFFTLLIFPFFLNAQTHCKEGGGTGEEATVTNYSSDRNGVVTTQNITFSSNNSKIKGTPYAFKNWTSGEILNQENISKKYDKIQLDLEKNQVIVYINGSKIPTNIPSNQVSSFSVKEKKGVKYYKMIRASKFSNDTQDKLYETFSPTNDFLIKETKKYVHESNDPNQEGFKKMVYKKKTTYYIKNKSGKYVKTKLSKKNLLKIMKDKEKDVKSYIEENNLTYEVEDLIKILSYYHSLTS